jgi:hypothetical protein
LRAWTWRPARCVFAAARARHGASTRPRADATCAPRQALGAKKAVLAAPTYHFYRAGELVTSFSGAMPHRLIELLDTHKGAAEAKRGGTKLMALLGILAAGGAALALANSLSSKRAAAAAWARGGGRRRRQRRTRAGGRRARRKSPRPNATPPACGLVSRPQRCDFLSYTSQQCTLPPV